MTSHPSPYVALLVEHPVLNMEADEFTLRVIADRGAIRVPADISYIAEAHALSERRLALRVWAMPDVMHEIIAAAGHQWFDCEHKAWKRRDRIRFGQAPRPLRQAYAVAALNVEEDIAMFYRRGLTTPMVLRQRDAGAAV